MRILIFATTYIQTEEQARLFDQWVVVNRLRNADCDMLAVDSCSPLRDRVAIYSPEVQIIDFADNIGHLARGGGDGWGRAFCAGIEWAIRQKYDYVVHVEGDSLFRLSVKTICEQMANEYIVALGTPVHGTKRVENGWVETGLMFFATNFLKETKFVESYDWQDISDKKYPHTPEAVIYEILGAALEMTTWKTIRDDKEHLTVDNVKDYDWVTHTSPEVYDSFVKVVHNMDHPHQYYGGRTFAQHGDDLAILNIFKCLRILQPSYIDIGAHHPVELSNTALLYQRGSRGINVEANVDLIQAFDKMRPEDINICAAVVGDKEQQIATLHRLNATSGINSLLPENLTMHGGARDMTQVRATTIDAIIDEHAKGCWPDLLSIDAEGMDLEILRSIDFSRGAPKVVCAEAVSQHGDISNDLRAFMTSNGYIVHSWAGNNMFFVRAELQDWLR